MTPMKRSSLGSRRRRRRGSSRSRSSRKRATAEYLEHALNFERMAADEQNPELKADFERQAANYRKLAADRVKKSVATAGFPVPPQLINAIQPRLAGQYT